MSASLRLLGIRNIFGKTDVFWGKTRMLLHTIASLIWQYLLPDVPPYKATSAASQS